jgi:hypothetical protein
MKYLPTFLRRWIATAMGLAAPEWGGIIYDFLEGRDGSLTEIHRWDDVKGQQMSLSLIENAHESERDFIYVVAVKTGKSSGYFLVLAKGTRYWMCGFRPNVYEPLEAYRHTIRKAKRELSRLGYRLREEAGTE